MESKTIEPTVTKVILLGKLNQLIVRPTRKKTNSFRYCYTSFGDAQIPFHDERALDLALLAITEVQPDNVVLLGDMLDPAMQGRFLGRPEWANTVKVQ